MLSYLTELSNRQQINTRKEATIVYTWFTFCEIRTNEEFTFCAIRTNEKLPNEGESSSEMMGPWHAMRLDVHQLRPLRARGPIDPNYLRTAPLHAI